LISLDDEQALRAGDRSGLLDAFATLPEQLKEGHRLGTAVDLPGWDRPDAVVLCGMGGSAAAADVVATGFSAPMVPILVVRAEELPDFVNERTLVIGISYSGETEETLRAVDDAQGRGARLVTIASGGRLAANRPFPTVVVPDEVPSPRAAIGLLTGAATAVLDRSNVSFSAEGDPGQERAEREDVAFLASVLATLAPDVSVEENLAKHVAEWLGGRVPVIWSSIPFGEGTAWRWKAAFNENAKIPAFSGSLPELMHHEIAGWTKSFAEPFAVIVLRWPGERPGPDGQDAVRVEGMLETLREEGIAFIEADLPVLEGTRIADQLAMMAIGDFASTYHALMRGVDPTPIEAIARIKDRLR
jgi:glucose/mannose-6-phosphate isomerase